MDNAGTPAPGAGADPVQRADSSALAVQFVHHVIDGVEPARILKHLFRCLDIAAFDDFVAATGYELPRASQCRLQMKLQIHDSFVVDIGLVRAPGAAGDVYRAIGHVEGIAMSL